MNTKHRELPITPLAPLSFYLAIFLLFFPLHADLLAGAAHVKRIDLAILFSSICIGIVAIPTVAATTTFIRKRGAFRGRRYLYPTFVLILLNLYISYATIHAMLYPVINQHSAESRSGTGNHDDKPTVIKVLESHEGRGTAPQTGDQPGAGQPATQPANKAP